QSRCLETRRWRRPSLFFSTPNLSSRRRGRQPRKRSGKYRWLSTAGIIQDINAFILLHDLMIKHEGLDDAFVRAPLRTRAKETSMFTRRDGLKLALAAAVAAGATRGLF